MTHPDYAPRVSIIIPALNEAEGIVQLLEPLQACRQQGAEIIVVDGGSADGTVPLATPLVDCVVATTRGRGHQMNIGASRAQGKTLLFIHADTHLPSAALMLVEKSMAGGACWGRFNVRIDGRSIWLPLIATLMNVRSRLTGIATGDQAIFVSSAAFREVGGFPEIPLMEDISLSKALLKRRRPVCLTARVTTSGRRWEAHGVWRTIIFMWWLRLRYFFGADPTRLALAYGYGRHDD